MKNLTKLAFTSVRKPPTFRAFHATKSVNVIKRTTFVPSTLKYEQRFFAVQKSGN